MYIFLCTGVLLQLHPAQGASLIGTPPGIWRPVRVLGPGLEGTGFWFLRSAFWVVGHAPF